MNRQIQVRRRKDVPLIAVYEGVTRGEQLSAYMISYYCTRIWMGVCPPEGGEPGYAAVLGEIYNPNPDQREPLVRLLDETKALDPVDFSPAELRRYQIPRDNARRPTKRRLGQGIIALKDIYWPQLVLLPPGKATTVDSSKQGSPFTAFVRRLNGLMAYDMTRGQRYFRQWWPFYSSTRRVVDGVIEVEEEDRDYNLALVDAQYEAGTFQVNENCIIYLDEGLQTARRCVGLVLHEMEIRDIGSQPRRWQFSDGYADPVEDPEWEDEVDRQMRDSAEMWRWWAGMSGA